MSMSFFIVFLSSPGRGVSQKDRSSMGRWSRPRCNTHEALKETRTKDHRVERAPPPLGRRRADCVCPTDHGQRGFAPTDKSGQEDHGAACYMDLGEFVRPPRPTQKACVLGLSDTGPHSTSSAPGPHAPGLSLYETHVRFLLFRDRPTPPLLSLHSTPYSPPWGAYPPPEQFSISPSKELV